MASQDSSQESDMGDIEAGVEKTRNTMASREPVFDHDKITSPELNMVWWDEPADQDPANPMNWTTWQKWIIISILSFITFLTYGFSLHLDF